MKRVKNVGETERKSKKWRDKNREESADGSCADVPVEKKTVQ